ncbi:MAG: hypothetical protein ABFD54_09440 [Armatimonadota bacterium]|nr:hypothetical protein [bacterium]
MVENYLIHHTWLPALLWVVLYSSDYFLTLVGAKLIRRQSFFEYEGSYELTPEYQDDIDKARKLSPRFVVWLLFGVGVLLAPAITGVPSGWEVLYGIFMGALIGPELVVHIRHIRNITSFSQLASPSAGVVGHLSISKRYSYKCSCVELGSFAGLLLVLCGFTMSPILLGGALATTRHALSHYKLAASSKPNPDMVKQNDTNN